MDSRHASVPSRSVPSPEGSPGEGGFGEVPADRHTIGPYRLLESIGGGCLTEVFRAEHQLLGALAAVKTLRPLFADEAIARRRLAEEARLTSALSDHPNIVTVQDFVIGGDGRLALVLELVRGKTLAALEAPPLDEVLAIGRQIADALAAVHAAGLVHGDPSPGNVLVSRRCAGEPHATLIDFGVTIPHGHRVGGAGGVAGTGTPGIRSPEQERGEPLDQRSDLYGLGALLHHLITGLPPTDPRADLRAGLAALLRRTARPAASMAGARFAVARDLCDLVSRCLCAVPGARPSSAAELSDRLAWLGATLSGDLPPVGPRSPGDGEPYEEFHLEIDEDAMTHEHPHEIAPPEPPELLAGPGDEEDEEDELPPAAAIRAQLGSAAAALSLLLVVAFGLAALVGRAMLVDPTMTGAPEPAPIAEHEPAPADLESDEPEQGDDAASDAELIAASR